MFLLVWFGLATIAGYDPKTPLDIAEIQLLESGTACLAFGIKRYNAEMVYLDISLLALRVLNKGWLQK